MSLENSGAAIPGPPRPGTAMGGGERGERGLAGPKATCDPWHPDEPLTMYCLVCRTAVCCECVKEATRHQGHDVQSLSTAVKQQKVGVYTVVYSGKKC